MNKAINIKTIAKVEAVRKLAIKNGISSTRASMMFANFKKEVRNKMIKEELRIMEKK